MYFYFSFDYTKIVHLPHTKSNIMPHPNEGQPTTHDHQTITQAEFASYTAQVDHIPRIFGVDVSMKPGDH